MAYRNRQRSRLNEPKVGPITRMQQAREYLEQHKVPVMFESLIASLMMEQPENQFRFMNAKLEAIKEIGLENVDWEAFIYHLHPLRDPIRTEFVKSETGMPKSDQPPYADLDDVPINMNDLEAVDESYKPELFLTEPQDDDEDDEHSAPMNTSV